MRAVATDGTSCFAFNIDNSAWLMQGKNLPNKYIFVEFLYPINHGQCQCLLFNPAIVLFKCYIV